MLHRLARFAASKSSAKQSLRGCLLNAERQGICSTSYACSAASLNVPVYNLSHEQVGETQLPPGVFGIDVRKDILHRVVRWQRAKAQQGTHATKIRSDVRGGGRKPHNQKGTGKARQGSIRAPQMRGGGIVHGPVVRSHAHKLPKKVRRLGLKSALSARALEQRVWIVNNLQLEEAKTKLVNAKLAEFFGEDPSTRKSLLLVGDRVANPEESVQINKAVSNLGWVDILPTEALNVYSILRRSHLMMTQQALDSISQRLSQPITRGPLDRRRLEFLNSLNLKSQEQKTATA